jgi:SAM-dependent methyltransferase
MYLAIKDLMKRSRLATQITHRLRNTRRIESLDELDTFLDGIQQRYPLLDDKATHELQRVCFQPRNLDLPDDPFSPEYRERQMELYFRISGKESYKLEYESEDFDPEKEKHDFYPYNSRSLRMVGDQLITQGLMLRNMNLRAGASIVEFGAGSGNTSLNLALTGYDVTSVEVGKAAGEVIKYRAKVHGRSIDVVSQGMIDFVESTDKKFDAALFVASFHHCENHAVLLENLSRILKPGGVIYFADEPFVYSRSPTVPYPWGLRLDGLSLYFIRKRGWLELGFELAYIRKALFQSGWDLHMDRTPLDGFTHFYTARRRP